MAASRKPQPHFISPEDRQAMRILTLVRLICPTGWSYQEQAGMYRLYLRQSPAVNAAEQRVFPQWVQTRAHGVSLDPFFAAFIAPRIHHLLSDSILSFAAAQTAAHEALLACALERCRLAHGEYPDSLGDLSPRYLEKLPHDVITGQPLKYRRTQDGQFVLYSVGWNEADDGGTPGTWTDWRGVSHWGQNQGDWVWAFPSENRGTDEAVR